MAKKMRSCTRKGLILALIVVAALSPISLKAQLSGDTVRLLLDFPLLDLPYQRYASSTYGNFFAGYGAPSMKQSLQTTTNFYSAAHFGLKELFKGVQARLMREILTHGAAGLFDLLIMQIPFGNGWLHEEYHRNVLTRREIESANEINKFPVGKEVFKVYKIKDEGLERLHDNHQNEWRRLQTAGGEAELHLLQTLQRNNFYYTQGLPNVVFYWLIAFSTGEYVRSCARDEFNQIVDDMNKEDGTDILIRDFTGPDYTAWAYSLFRPDLPYRARGIHPSGVGINRYIKPSDLSQEERDFLRRQGRLMWLNFLSPTMFGFSKIRLKSHEYGNFAVRSVLTPFGNDISIELWAQTARYNFYFLLHNYLNNNELFTGMEMGMVDQPLFKGKLAISPRLMMWRQPENLSFTTDQGQLGGLIGLKARANLGRFSPYLEVEGKTAGWVMGNVFLEENVSLNAGLNILFR
ncbi:MAG: hypothetical protein NZM43_08105 [Saprospiraceae bacterium]|nr:hypothetical protein [Saprospiraceae bacterium]MDW8484271.1 hypothetical protein [Saprospiraceae bacterium]